MNPNRELKFRAWDVPTKSMHMLDPKKRKGVLWDLEGNDKWIVMQYTGLKDKHGVEIYEGDILSGEWGEQQTEMQKEKITAPVVYIYGGFKLDWWMKKLSLADAAIGIRWRESYHNGDKFYEVTPLEVIGNIYTRNDGGG